MRLFAFCTLLLLACGPDESTYFPPHKSSGGGAPYGDTGSGGGHASGGGSSSGGGHAGTGGGHAGSGGGGGGGGGATMHYCRGSATPCSYYLGICEGQDGCYTRSGSTDCGGFATSCSTYFDQYSCTAQEGCYWQ